MGNGTGYRFFTLVVHYSNPLGVVGSADSSGIVLYYTQQLRGSNAAVLKLGYAAAINSSVTPGGGGGPGAAGHEFSPRAEGQSRRLVPG